MKSETDNALYSGLLYSEKEREEVHCCEIVYKVLDMALINSISLEAIAIHSKQQKRPTTVLPNKTTSKSIIILHLFPHCIV